VDVERAAERVERDQRTGTLAAEVVRGLATLGRNVREAQTRAYEAVRRIDWPGGFYRHDIGWRAIAREEAKR